MPLCGGTKWFNGDFQLIDSSKRFLWVYEKLKVERNHVQCINSNGHQGAIPLDAKNLDLVKSDRKYPSLI